MGRPKRREQEALFDADLADLPDGVRWREWMGRVEAAIFASREPVPREALATLVGPRCNLDELIADIIDELRARPYELVFVAGGWQFRTRPRFANAIRATGSGDLRDVGAPELTPTEILAITAIAYLQPATRTQISRLAGKEISRDVIGALKRHGLVDAGLRAPEPGAPFAYVTTRKFLEVFGLASLRDLPDIKRLEDEGLLQRAQSDIDLDGALGLVEDDGQVFERDMEFDGAEIEDTADDAWKPELPRLRSSRRV
jgi:chromosome segregation and condensation protein ScpB